VEFDCVVQLIEIISQAVDGQHLLSKTGQIDELGKDTKMLPITLTLAIFPILTLIPVLRARPATMNDPQEPHQRSRRSLGWDLGEDGSGSV
jgi:hypothetical protein